MATFWYFCKGKVSPLSVGTFNSFSVSVDQHPTVI